MTRCASIIVILMGLSFCPIWMYKGIQAIRKEYFVVGKSDRTGRYIVYRKRKAQLYGLFMLTVGTYGFVQALYLIGILCGFW
jgi:hypothetical protein